MAAYTKTTTNTKSYTKTRIQVIDDHFEMFLRCSNMSDSKIKKMLLAVENQELEAVGIYLQEGGYLIAEVEFSIDWEKHEELVRFSGKTFNTDIGGWKEGLAPEAYVSVQKLVQLAKERKLQIRSWIRVSDRVRNSPQEYRMVCERLGYVYGSKVASWKNTPYERIREINFLDEAKVTTRVGSI